MRFEAGLVVGRAAFKQHNERLEQRGLGAIVFREIEQRGENAQIVPCRTKIARDDESHAIAIERGLGSDAWKPGVADEAAELLGERMVEIIGGAEHCPQKRRIRRKGCDSGDDLVPSAAHDESDRQRDGDGPDNEQRALRISDNEAAQQPNIEQHRQSRQPRKSRARHGRPTPRRPRPA